MTHTRVHDPINKKLNERELKYCVYSLLSVETGRYSAECARMAGYSEEYAKNFSLTIRQKPKIQKLLRETMEEIIQKVGVHLEYRLRKLKRSIDLSIPEDANHWKECDVKNGLGAIHMINQIEGAYAPTKQVSEIIGTANREELREQLTQDEKDILDKFKREF